MEAERAEDPVAGQEAAVTGKPPLRERRWLRVLAAGVFFIALMEASYLAYPNPNLVPAMIVYAAFLVPPRGARRWGGSPSPRPPP